MTTGPQRNGTEINALFCDLHAETMPFGPAGTAGTLQDTTYRSARFETLGPNEVTSAHMISVRAGIGRILIGKQLLTPDRKKMSGVRAVRAVCASFQTVTSRRSSPTG